MKVVTVIDVTTAGVTAAGVTPDPKTLNPLTLLSNRKKAYADVETVCQKWGQNVSFNPVIFLFKTKETQTFVYKFS